LEAFLLTKPRPTEFFRQQNQNRKESREMQTMVNRKVEGLSQDVNERFKKLEVRELMPMMMPPPQQK